MKFQNFACPVFPEVFCFIHRILRKAGHACTVKENLEFNVPAVAVNGTLQPGGIASVVGEGAFDRIPVEARIINITHIAQLTENRGTGTGLSR